MKRIVLPLLLLCSCTSEDVAGSGSLQLSLSGGLALREGFPHEEPGFERHEFVDGWSLSFDKYIVAVGDVRLREQLPDGESGDGMVVAEWTGPAVVDLTSAPSGVELVTLEDVPATRLDLGLDLVPAAAGAQNISAAQEDFDRMVAEGYTFYVEGTATNTSTTVRFEVGLTTATRFRRCTNGVDQTRGIAVEADKTTGAFVYPHAVHIWWDVLVDGTPELRFDPWAAVAGPDGVITAEELATQDLLDLRDAQGNQLLDPATNSPVRYDDGGLLPPDQLDLLSYATYGFRQSVHFNGLGFCPWTPL